MKLQKTSVKSKQRLPHPLSMAKNPNDISHILCKPPPTVIVDEPCNVI